MSDSTNKIVCENNCLYSTNIYDTYCDICNEHLKSVIGFKLAMLFWNKFDNEPDENLYQKGIKQGLLMSQGIVRGEDPKFWVQ